MLYIIEFHYQHQSTLTYIHLLISKTQECKQGTDYNFSLFHHRELRVEGPHCFHRIKREREVGKRTMLSVTIGFPQFMRWKFHSMTLVDLLENNSSYKKKIIMNTQYSPPHLHYPYFCNKENTCGFKVCS